MTRAQTKTTLETFPNLKPVTFLTGDAGMGKTTMLAEISDRINRSGVARCVVTDCSTPLSGIDVGSVEALHPWITAMRELAQPNEKSASKKLAADLALAWVKFIPIVGDAIESTVSTVGIIKRHRSTTTEPPTSKEHVFEQCISFFKKASEVQPLVVIIDDAHWADDSSVNLLFALARFGGPNLRFIVAYRPFDVLTSRNGAEHALVHIHRELDRYELSQHIELEGLNEEELRDVLKQNERDITDATLSQINKFSAGNPLLALGWRKGGSAAPTVEAVVRERIQRLETDTRDLLSMAALEGEQFTSLVLRKISEIDPLSLATMLRKAESEHGLVRSLGKRELYATETPTYEFTSQALQTVFEKLRGDEERELLHSAIADVLIDEQQQLDPNHAAWMPVSARLAAHLDLADRDEESAKINLDVAHRAWELYADAEAMSALVMANAVLKKRARPKKNILSMRITALDLESRIHQFVRRVSEANAATDEMRRLAVEIGDTESAVNALIRSAQIANLTGHPDDTQRFAQQALQESEAIGYETGKRGAYSMLGMWHEAYGRVDEAIAAFEHSVKIAEENGADVARATALGNLGRLYQHRDEYEKALRVNDEAMSILEQHKVWDVMARALNNSGICLVEMGRLDEALKRYLHALELHERIGDRIGASSLRTNLGQLCLREGNIDEALRYFDESISIKRDLQDGYGLSIAVYSKGLALAELKKNAEALELLLEAHRIALEIGEQLIIQEIERVIQLVKGEAASTTRGDL